jgi:hypothetical protein
VLFGGNDSRKFIMSLQLAEERLCRTRTKDYDQTLPH